MGTSRAGAVRRRQEARRGESGRFRSGALRIAATVSAMLLVARAGSAQVTAVGAVHHDGQTFLTWTCPPGVGWIYRVYRSSSAIQSTDDLAAATMVGMALDSSACDRRLSRLCGTTYGYVVDSGAAPLDPTGGLFVWSADAAGPAWYAVTSHFPIDTSRVYVTGGSMGGIAGVFLAMWRPDLIAAAMVTVPLFDFSFTSDPNPSSFNEGGRDRLACDRLWGSVRTGLHTDDGTPVYERLNAGALARSLEARHVPPFIIAFSGRKDSTIGWAEKIPFYRAMRESRAGGTFFWDTRGHGDAATAGAWFPMQDFRYVSRFRTNLSFPALSNCSADDDPGDGHAAVGDSIGTINGFVEWDDIVVDEPAVWRVRLTLRNFATLWGQAVTAPDSLTVDVTPRRLQRFIVSPEQPWRVVRLDDGATVQSGVVAADALGVVTIPAVNVYRSGSVLEVGQLPNVGVGAARPARPRIGALPSPLRNACTLAIEWPYAGDATVTLLDVAGRRVRTIFHGRIESERQDLPLDPAGLPSGAYFVLARQGNATTVRRFAVMH